MLSSLLIYYFNKAFGALSKSLLYLTQDRLKKLSFS